MRFRVFDAPAQTLQLARFQRLGEGDAASPAPDPDDRSQRLDPVYPDEQGSAEARRRIEMQAATEPRDILHPALRRAPSEHEAAIDRRFEPRNRAVAQLAEFFGRDHAVTDSGRAMKIVLDAGCRFLPVGPIQPKL